MARVHKIRMGFSNAYLVQGKADFVLVDAGHSNRARVFSQYLEKQGISPGQIKLIVITHVHFDHVGSLKQIKELCGCPVAIHEKEALLLRKGLLVLPPGTNLFAKTASCLGRKFATRLMTFEAVEPDILCAKDRSLESFGIYGRIISTPGHTDGSLSVLLATGEAFVGDLAANYLPFGLGPICPPFAVNVPELFKSWERLLSAGATKIFPAHGRPFPAELLSRRLLS
jgi:hydroxyacylglutathione hydrolase